MEFFSPPPEDTVKVTTRKGVLTRSLHGQDLHLGPPASELCGNKCLLLKTVCAILSWPRNRLIPTELNCSQFPFSNYLAEGGRVGMEGLRVSGVARWYSHLLTQSSSMNYRCRDKACTSSNQYTRITQSLQKDAPHCCEKDWRAKR